MDTAWLFAPRYFKQIAQNYHLVDIPNLQHKKERIADWQKSIRNKTITKNSEIQLQTDFLKLFFEEVLGYTNKVGKDAWNLDSEFSIKDGKRADGYLGYFDPDEKDIRVVIELKDAKTDLDRKQNRKDAQTPVEQAFSYAHKIGASCKWVILSNFREIRLYPAGDSNRYEVFHILDLLKEENLKRFLFLLHKERLILKQGESHTERHYRQRQEREQTISKEFYAKFKLLRANLFEHLREHNTEVEEFTLFSKAQKILDRIIFVFFCEDTGMLPYKITRKVIEAGSQSFSVSDENIWQQLKGLFDSIDKGNPPHQINKFNGGLFASDMVLDGLTIKDGILQEILALENYDFESDLNVNILGHIFEQSISDIEEIKAQIAGEAADKKKSKRKKDGIFYTPEYITRYIVKEAVGGWLEDRKQELGVEDLPELEEEDFKSIRRIQSGKKKGRIEGNKKIEKHRKFWVAYKEKLANIKVVDPACGSGAFLVQVFDFLYKEGQMVNREMSRLSLGQTSTEDLDKLILANNIYGVDLNEESVEITKLSLWLKTANKQSELTALDQNILCGNSLIDDPEVAGEKAFKWENRFKEIFDNGGFDVIVGNPPYGAIFSKIEKNYLLENYKTTQGNYDSFKFFFELEINILKKDGYFSNITPNTFLVVEKGAELRELLFFKNKVISMLEVFDVFPDAVVEPLISTIKKVIPKQNDTIYSYLVPRGTKISGDLKIVATKLNFNQNSLLKRNNLIFNYRETRSQALLIEKLSSSSKTVIDYAMVTAGVKPYERGKGTPKQTAEIVKDKPFNSFNPSGIDWYPVIRGTDINRYLVKWSGEFIKYGPWLAAPRKENSFFDPKIFMRRTDDKLMSCIDEDKMIGVNSVHCIQLRPSVSVLSLNYLLGLLNSKLINWFFQAENFHMVGKPLAEVKVVFVERLPIKVGKFNTQIEGKVQEIVLQNKSLYDNVLKFLKLIKSELEVEKVSRGLGKWYALTWADFMKELKKAKVILTLAQKAEWMEYFEEEKAKVEAIQAEIVKTDREIDQMVYELYGLTEEEIRIVEESVR